MQLRLTHRLRAGGPERPADWLAIGDERRFFVPGWVPCGECGSCRRGWVAACPRGRTLLDDVPTVELSERFLAAIDDPPGVASLSDAQAVCAGVVAEALELAARAGLGAGDAAVWIGDDARLDVGARLAAARGSAVFRLLGAASGQTRGITPLPFADGPRAWTETLTGAASAASGGFQERRLFLADDQPEALAAALALVVPGTTLALFGASGDGQLSPRALTSGRMIVGAGRGYHPDFVPEALAALRRDPELLTGLLIDGGRRAAHVLVVEALSG